jgi:hypothetical protein
MFPDFADDDRFWAKPLDKRVSAGALPPAPTRAPIGADA